LFTDLFGIWRKSSEATKKSSGRLIKKESAFNFSQLYAETSKGQEPRSAFEEIPSGSARGENKAQTGATHNVMFGEGISDGSKTSIRRRQTRHHGGA